MQKVQASAAGKFLYGLYFTAAATILAFPCSATSAAFSVVAIIALLAHCSHAGSTATRTRTLITICSRAFAGTITNRTFAVSAATSRTTGARIPSKHLAFLYYRDGPVIYLALSFSRSSTCFSRIMAIFANQSRWLGRTCGVFGANRRAGM